MGEKTLSAKLNRHFAAIGAATAAVTGVAMTQSADAGLVVVTNANINVPSTTAGVYLNLVTGVNATTPAGAPGWDINPWGSTSNNIWANNAAGPQDGVVGNFAGGSSATLVDNLPQGASVNNTLTYVRSNGLETTGPTAFSLGTSNNLVGIRFLNESTNQLNFGWVRILLNAAGAQPRTIVEYAYDNAGEPVLAGVIPEPASLGLLALGAMGLVARRGR